MRKSIATVSVSGTLTEKLEAIAAAGFDGVEIFENDLLTCPLPPEEIRLRAADLGLSVEMYQPFRDFEAMPELDLRRAERKFQIMERLGAGLLLVCSNVSPRAVDDDDLAAEQLRLLAERAAGHGIRIAYEALAWGRHVNEYLHSWRIVRMADHPDLGVCLDSFHILSRGSDPIGIEAIPGEKIFFLQLADAPLLAMDVLQWSRHYRCFPGQGASTWPGSSPTCGTPGTPGRCRWRCSTTTSGRPTRTGPPWTRCGRWSPWRARPTPPRRPPASPSPSWPPRRTRPGCATCSPPWGSPAPGPTAANPWSCGSRAGPGCS
nr:hypothetical protein GCM10020093_080370 [Planobispora longispora]